MFVRNETSGVMGGIGCPSHRTQNLPRLSLVGVQVPPPAPLVQLLKGLPGLCKPASKSAGVTNVGSTPTTSTIRSLLYGCIHQGRFRTSRQANSSRLPPKEHSRHRPQRSSQRCIQSGGTRSPVLSSWSVLLEGGSAHEHRLHVSWARRVRIGWSENIGRGDGRRRHVGIG